MTKQNPKSNATAAAGAALVLAPLVAVVAWICYSVIAIDHCRRLPPALPGSRTMLTSPAGAVCLYALDETGGVPLLLIHSINAAASAFEMRPLYAHYAHRRAVYAIDLPGYGLSERRDRIYKPRDMADAIHAATKEIQARHGGGAIDLMALSTSCEYAARVVIEQPNAYRSVGLISPVGFDKALSGDGPAGSTKGNNLRHALVSVPLWSQALYDLVVSRPSMRFFLTKTFGSKRINEDLFAYDQLTAQQPHARHVVWSFLSGYLFAADVSRLYRILALPVWTVHGRRGDFVDFRRENEVAGRSNWTFEEVESGAMPQFECLDRVAASYDAFLERLAKA